MAIKFLNTVQVDTDVLYVDASTNRVGIGTTSPGSKLTVDGSTRLGGDVEVSELLSGDKVLTLTANAGSFNIGDIDGIGDRAFISGDSSSIEISINQSTSLYCDSNNRVGIGTTSPSEKLVVRNETSNTDVKILAYNSAAGTEATLKFSTIASETNYEKASIIARNAAASFGRSDMHFALDSAADSGNVQFSDTKMTILNSGNVGIGTTSPSTVLEVSSSGVNGIDISQSASNASQSGRLFFTTNTASEGFALFNSNGTFQVNSGGIPNNTSGTNRISIIGSSGNVGIGTTSPDAKLEVSSSSGGVLRLTSTDTSVATGESIGRVEFKSNDASTGGNNVMGFVDCLATNAGSTYALTFGTGNAAAATEKMRINQSGNVGIGTDSPSELLHISSLGPARLLIEADTDNVTETDNAQIILKQDGGAVVGNLGFKTGTNTVEVRNEYTGVDGHLSLSTSNTERLHIKYNGNVGIGTTSPEAKLHVSNGLLRTWAPTSGTSAIFESTVSNRNFVTLTAANEAELWFGNAATQAKGRVRYEMANNNMEFWTNATQKMVIDGSGNVGIGTTSLTSISSTSRTLSLGSTSTTTSGGIAFQANSVVKAYNYVANNYLINQTVAGIGQIFYGAGSERMRIHNTTGNVGIGTTSPSFQLQLSTNSAAKPSSNVWTVTSDSRVKENIRDYTTGLEAILKIEPKLYDYNGKAGFEKTKNNIGIIAQDIQKVMPETVNAYNTKLNEDDAEDTELLNFDGHAVTFALINAVKDLKAEIEELKKQINK